MDSVHRVLMSANDQKYAIVGDSPASLHNFHQKNLIEKAFWREICNLPYHKSVKLHEGFMKVWVDRINNSQYLYDKNVFC